MKTFIKIIVFAVIGIFVIVGGLLSYVKIALPDVGDAPDIKVEATPQRVARGEYLANHVTVCIDCHSTRQWNVFAGPITPGTEGIGGEKFDQNMGFPGEFYAANITSYHLKDWTDGELFRLITSGVSKDGHAIFPVMPYLSYGKMSREDIYSIIAYVRTLPAQTSESKPHKADFPMNFILNTIPTKAQLTEIPSENDTLRYGAYLVNAAACADCHTKKEKGKPVAGMDFAGGFEFKMPGGSTFSANITTDKKTGIGTWTKEQFVNRFKIFTDSTYRPTQLSPTDFQTPMPWMMYSGMKKSDLEAIYTYLMTTKAVNHQVTKFVAR